MNDLPHIGNRLELAERTRREYKLARAIRLASGPTAGAPPEVRDIADTDDGTLYRAAVDKDMTVWIPKGSNFFDGSTLTLQVDRGQDFEHVGDPITIDSSTQYPVPMTLPKKAMLEEGTFELRYQISLENTSESDAVTLRVDRTPPWGSSNPPYVEMDTALITDAYLASHPAGIEVTLPAYDDQKGNDMAYLWFASNINDLGEPTLISPVPADRKFVIKVEDAKAWKDGPLYVLYRLMDIAGNISEQSLYYKLSIALGTLPTNLKKPVVPLAADGLLDLEDARTGVIVEIPEFDNPKATDTLAVTWGNTSLPPQTIGTQTPPYEVQIPNSILRDEYRGNTGAVDLAVSYTVLRGEEVFGPESDTIKVDFSVVGPVQPDPDWPDPINAKLTPCEVRGNVSDLKNELTRADNKLDATLSFEPYENIKDGEIVRFYWNDVHVTGADYTVDTSAPAPWTVSIPWAYIEETGNTDDLPVQYGIWDKNLTNEQRSPVTHVKVNAVVTVAPQPSFEGLGPTGALNCNSLVDPNDPAAEPAFRVSVPDLTAFGLKAGDTVNMVWTPYQDETGGTPITGATLEEAIVLGPDFPVTGFVWRVEPYDKHILPIYQLDILYGRGEVTYSFDMKGEKVDSELLSAKVALGLGGGTACKV
ncbi:hypothetical protein F3J44_28490 [Pantoea sp. Tr-811]|uniref:hypothetical protein n=1 Tax=Pantoea sp. Tr-811 TaxID=2608361 RepID=UPI00141F4105|nr:hypothetical protein [Pantoea sp. Tr-811]NIF30280.1 hypothetical protein [Pantoea sp. Tr-811]